MENEALSKPKFLIGLLVAVTLCASCSRSASEIPNRSTATNTSSETPPITSTSVVKVTPREIVVTNGVGEGTVVINIDPGYHVNANPPTYPYLKATELDIPASRGLSVGFVVYPDPITKKFRFADKPLAVYEGQTNLKVHLKSDKTVKPGAQNLSAKLRVQACDEQVCYAPGEINFVIPVSIK